MPQALDFSRTPLFNLLPKLDRSAWPVTQVPSIVDVVDAVEIKREPHKLSAL